MVGMVMVLWRFVGHRIDIDGGHVVVRVRQTCSGQTVGGAHQRRMRA